MKTKRIKFAAIILGLTLLSASAWASDYSTYTTEELHGMRGSMRENSEEERNAFRYEWQKRMREMPVEERGKYVGPPEDAPRDGSGQGKQMNKSQGENQGSGKAYGYGHGKSQGSSENYGSEMGGGPGAGGGHGGGGRGR